MKTLIFHNGNYKYFTSSWQTIGVVATESDFISFGIDDINIITEESWAELDGEVELCLYSDESSRAETTFNIETEPFTLLEEWNGKQIQVIEYTDNPNQAESSITLETEPYSVYDYISETPEALVYTESTDDIIVSTTTEPFTLEDHFEGNEKIDVLVYTDSGETPTVKTEIGYSPIDELADTFDIVTYAENDDDLVEINVTADVVPKGQFITKFSDILYYGDIKKFVASITSDNPELSKIRFLLSFDNGASWKSYKHMNWKNVNTADKFDVLYNGMRVNEINSVTSDLFNEVVTNGIRIGYYIEERAWTNENEAIDVAKVHSDASVKGVTIADLFYFVVNTLPVIEANMLGNKILGSVTDEDLGRVQYRVKFNGEFVYPLDGAYTTLYDTPYNLDVAIDNNKIIIGSNNTVQVEFKDGWGNIESWSTSFIGKPIGLIFSTPTGQYYSNGFGEIMRYLNFGTMIAGQTSLDEKVVLTNTLSFPVKDLILTTDTDANGMEIQLSKTANPFVAQEGLIFNDELNIDDSVEFHVRLKLNDNAVGNHTFEILAEADPV